MTGRTQIGSAPLSLPAMRCTVVAHLDLDASLLASLIDQLRAYNALECFLSSLSVSTHITKQEPG